MDGKLEHHGKDERPKFGWVSPAACTALRNLAEAIRSIFGDGSVSEVFGGENRSTSTAARRVVAL